MRKKKALDYKTRKNLLFAYDILYIKIWKNLQITNNHKDIQNYYYPARLLGI